MPDGRDSSTPGAAAARVDADTVLTALEADGCERVKLGGFDVDGILRGKYVSLSKLRSAARKGFGFCDVIFGWDSSDVLYDSARFTGWHTGYPDALARVDLATMRRIPWEDRLPFFICDFWAKDGSPLPVSPRQTLARVVERARGLGFEPVMACEYEFFIFAETPHSLRAKGFRDLTPLTPGMFGYSVLRASMNSELIHDIVRFMKAFDCEVEGIHTETGPGVYEVALACDAALRAADKAALFKTGLKEICARRGLTATFMAKWNATLPGCGGHIHQSLFDRAQKKNLFANEGGGSPSRLLESYAAGLVATLPELLPFYAPTVNSYKRLVPGTWAPVRATWGNENRTTALRVIGGPDAGATRVEMRVTGADMNPYLALAACLAGGLHGVERGLTLPPETRGNAYDAGATGATFARSLEAALPALKASAVAREYLGPDLVDHYVMTREWEVREAWKSVSSWELERYFESI
jgi:glutamine synthetase